MISGGFIWNCLILYNWTLWLNSGLVSNITLLHVTSQTNSSQRFNSTFPIDISEHCPGVKVFLVWVPSVPLPAHRWLAVLRRVTRHSVALNYPEVLGIVDVLGIHVDVDALKDVFALSNWSSVFALVFLCWNSIDFLKLRHEKMKSF